MVTKTGNWRVENTAWGMIRLCRLDKPVGILLLLWPTLWALLDASQGRLPIWTSFVLLCGVVLMRSAGCVINDFADRHWDGQVKRTCERPLVIGQVTEIQAIVLFAVLCLMSFGLVLTLNPLTIYMSFAAVALAILYPFTKRVTQLPQVVLGMAFSWAIPMSYAAIQNSVPGHAWWLFVANLLWTIAYDTQYAMVDRDDDVLVGIKSTAILFGEYDRLAIGLLQASALVCLAVFAITVSASPIFWIGLCVVAVLLAQQMRMIWDRDRSRCFTAFRANNWVGLTIAAAMAASIWTN